MASFRIPNSPELWQNHPLGPPNRGTMAVYDIAGHRFAIGRYSQHTDSHILTITRHLVLPGAREASHALARLRRAVKADFPKALALQTYTDEGILGTSYRADGWVFVTNRRGDRTQRKQKRWMRTL
jgi:hypothetical protein